MKESVPQSSSGAVVRRASSSFGFAFAWAASVNILPQTYLLSLGVEQKNLWLSCILFLGTLGAIVGVSVSRRQIGRGRRFSRTHWWLGTLVYGLPLFAVVIEIPSLLGYGMAYVLFRSVSNWLFNFQDNRLNDLAGKAHLGLHSTVTVATQILGQLIGPMAFVLIAGNTALSGGVLALVFGWSMATVADATCTQAPTGERDEETGVGIGRRFRDFPPVAYFYLAYATLVWAGIVTVFAELMYLLRDYMGVENPKIMAALLITCNGLVSVLTISVIMKFGGLRPSRVIALIPPLLLCAVPLVLGFKVPLVALFGCAFLSGTAGGFFMLLIRSVASSWKRPPGSAMMLSLHNNAANIASLFAYSAMGVTALTFEGDGETFSQVVLGVCLVFFLAAFAVALLKPSALDLNSTPSSAKAQD